MCIPIQYSVTWAHTSSAVSKGARLCRTHGHSHIQSSSTSFYSLNNKIKTCRTQRFPLGNTNKCSKKVSRLWFQTKVSRLWSQRKWPIMCTTMLFDDWTPLQLPHLLGNLGSAEYMVSWAHPSPCSNRHLDRFIRFCEAHGWCPVGLSNMRKCLRSACQDGGRASCTV